MNNGKVTVEGVKMTDAKLRSGTKCRSELLFTKGQRSGTSKGKLVSFWYCTVLYCTVPLTHLGKAARRHRHHRSSRQSREEAHPHTNTCTVLYCTCTVLYCTFKVLALQSFRYCHILGWYLYCSQISTVFALQACTETTLSWRFPVRMNI